MNNEQLEILNNIKISLSTHPMEGNVPRQVHMIQNGIGNLGGCLINLTSYHERKAEVAWFSDRDLDEFKLQCWIAAKLRYIHHTVAEPRTLADENLCVFGVFSDHESMIQWMTSLLNHTLGDRTFTSVFSDPKEHSYRYCQITLALLGHWDALAERAERFLADTPKNMKRFVADQRFYLALARRDCSGMESALQELTDAKLLKSRSDYLIRFNTYIAIYATLYAKIAWRHGFELDIDTPMIPREWLPVRPLPSYPDPYEFMRSYQIGT